jgi:aldose 1-epimerase
VRAPAPPSPGAPGFLDAVIAPDRGMLLLQARMRLASGLETGLLDCPPLEQAVRKLDGGPDDFVGSASYSLGAAILLPYANRITGAPGPDRTIEAPLGPLHARLPRNWGGKAPGARQYAMHGLLLDRRADRLDDLSTPDEAVLKAEIEAGDFAGRWPSRTALTIRIGLGAGRLELRVSARNTGEGPLPMGIGWHPYFAFPSGDRRQARLRLPARRRLEVGNYDEVLPTGRILDLQGTDHDFSQGRALGDLYLDDCFIDLARTTDGAIACRIEDPAAGHGLHVASRSPGVKAIQAYAPPDKAFVALEHQFNWPDPYGAEWPPGTDTGMALLQPGETAEFQVEVVPYAL